MLLAVQLKTQTKKLDILERAMKILNETPHLIYTIETPLHNRLK